MVALGEELRAARESRGLSILNVSEQIHIRSVYLQAIEEEDWTSIAAAVYVRGFVRTYARFLGLNAEDAVARFNEAFSVSKPQAAMPPPAPASHFERPAPMWLWGALAAVLLVVLVGYTYYKFQKSTQAAIMAESVPIPSGSLGAGPGEVGPIVGRGRGLSVKVEHRSWVRVLVDGKEEMEGVFEPGTQRDFQGKTATVKAGDPGAVAIAVNGKSIGMLGRSGGVLERTFTLARQ